MAYGMQGQQKQGAYGTLDPYQGGGGGQGPANVYSAPAMSGGDSGPQAQPVDSSQMAQSVTDDQKRKQEESAQQQKAVQQAIMEEIKRRMAAQAAQEAAAASAGVAAGASAAGALPAAGGMAGYLA